MICQAYEEYKQQGLTFSNYLCNLGIDLISIYVFDFIVGFLFDPLPYTFGLLLGSIISKPIKLLYQKLLAYINAPPAPPPPHI